MVHGRLLLSPRIYWYSRYKAGVQLASPAGTTLTAVPVGRGTGGTHLVQSVQSAHVVGWPRPIRAALSVHHHTDDSSTAHVVVPLAGVQGRRVPGRT